MDALVLNLAAVDATMLELVGDTAANLGELASAGLPVPDGFCVTVGAYREAAALAGLVGHPVSDTARAALLAAPVPPRVAEEVVTAYAALGADVPVAVRSSATAFPHVAGADAVLDAVHRCWASPWTDGGHPAVVVQRLVDSAASGAMVTANPVTGRRREAVVDAAPGLGLAGDPDRFVLGLDGGEVRERRPAAVHPTGLTDDQLCELAELGRRVEDDYGAPQDCEWALDTGGALWLTQARPITTLYPLPDHTDADPSGARAYVCASLAQGLVRPMTPMGLSAFRVLGSGLAGLAGVEVARPLEGPSPLVVAGQRPFVDITPALRHPLGRRLLVRTLGVVEARAAEVVRGLGEDSRFAVRIGSPWPLVRALARAVWRVRAPWRLLEALVSPRRARRRLAGEDERRAGAEPGADERLDYAERVLHEELPAAVASSAVAPAAGFLMAALAGRLLRGLTRPGDLSTALRAPAAEADLALRALATRIAGDHYAANTLRELPAAELAARYRTGTLPPVVQRGVAEFLAGHGHHAAAGIDLGIPRWADDPTDLFGALSNHLRRDVSSSPDEAAAEDTVRRLVASARTRGRWRALLVGLALRRARELAGMRGAPTNRLVAGLAPVRAAVAEVGVELASAGRLDDAGDVFFLTLAEARRALRGAELRTLVSVRREEYGRELRRRRVPRVLLSDGSDPQASSAVTSTEFSSWRVSAPAPPPLSVGWPPAG
ncbi:PEP/pyruvate-binding domain-containing protein [Pseudonocardia acaciae]|uniref:PEP/pyruvate-binding domain-containing protein n=1 Tax=Pseudonocardia acaciae TaxID=551276 RepID=UPI0006850291|nr:PEP/pyruvate-binding domain-containing protein [Pseudonocardia acaciae]